MVSVLWGAEPVLCHVVLHHTTYAAEIGERGHCVWNYVRAGGLQRQSYQ